MKKKRLEINQDSDICTILLLLLLLLLLLFVGGKLNMILKYIKKLNIEVIIAIKQIYIACEIIDFIIINLPKNPIKGGKPVIDNKLAINNILVYLLRTIFLICILGLLFNINIIIVNVILYCII